MAELLKGAAVTSAITERIQKQLTILNEKNITPTLAIVRVGERPDDVSYEKSAKKRCETVGIKIRQFLLPEDTSQEDLLRVIQTINDDCRIHGCLLFRPLPKHINESIVCETLKPEKDVDSITIGSLAGVFVNQPLGYTPCTAQAVMEILHYYQINCTGKNVVVIGRSLVIGRPVAMLLMHENATVTICHTKTANVEELSRHADIVIVASGQMESIGADYFRPGQIVIDVGIGWNPEKGKLCGDVKFDEVEPIVSAITPVPGGVGGVTTSVLISHVVEAALKLQNVESR